MQINKISVVLGLAIFTSGMIQVIANPVNITTADGVGAGTFFNPTSGSGLGSAHEDNETEAGTIPGQAWDLEEMLYDSSSKNLTIVGGFNFFAGGSGSGLTFNSGDIFIDVDGGVLPNPAEISGNTYNVINGNLGYDFVIHFNDRTAGTASNFQKLNSLSYEVRDIRNGAIQLYDVLYGILNESTPFIWKSGGTMIGTAGSPAGFSTYTSDAAANAAWSGVTTGWEDVASEAGAGIHNHYALTVNLANITSILGVALDESKFTIGCGNDMIKGDFTKAPQTLPDGGFTFALLGFALGGLSLFRRRTEGPRE